MSKKRLAERQIGSGLFAIGLAGIGAGIQMHYGLEDDLFNVASMTSAATGAYMISNGLGHYKDIPRDSNFKRDMYKNSSLILSNLALTGVLGTYSALEFMDIVQSNIQLEQDYANFAAKSAITLGTYYAWHSSRLNLSLDVPETNTMSPKEIIDKLRH